VSHGAIAHFAPLDPTFNHLYSGRSIKIFGSFPPKRPIAWLKLVHGSRVAVGMCVWRHRRGVIASVGQRPNERQALKARLIYSAVVDAKDQAFRKGRSEGHFGVEQ